MTKRGRERDVMSAKVSEGVFAMRRGVSCVWCVAHKGGILLGIRFFYSRDEEMLMIRWRRWWGGGSSVVLDGVVSIINKLNELLCAQDDNQWLDLVEWVKVRKMKL